MIALWKWPVWNRSSLKRKKICKYVPDCICSVFTGSVNRICCQVWKGEKALFYKGSWALWKLFYYWKFQTYTEKTVQWTWWIITYSCIPYSCISYASVITNTWTILFQLYFLQCYFEPKSRPNLLISSEYFIMYLCKRVIILLFHPSNKH